MKNMILLFLLALSSIQLLSQDVYSFFEKTDSFLKANVADGKVDYDAIHSNPKSLNELMTLGDGISVSKDDKQTYQAFWINA